MEEQEQSTGSGSEEACRRGKSIVTSFPISLSLLSYYIYVILGRQLDHAFTHSYLLVCVLGTLALLERLGCGLGPCVAASSSVVGRGSVS